jgi:hypothetical protein
MTAALEKAFGYQGDAPVQSAVLARDEIQMRLVVPFT